MNNIVRKIKNMFNSPAYRIISKAQGGNKFFLIQKRAGFSWEYVKDSTRVGYNNQIVEFPAFFQTLDAAEARISSDIKRAIYHTEVTKVECVYKNDGSISTE